MKIADLMATDLRWLLTGEAASPPVLATHPAVARIVRLLGDHPRAAEPLAAFVEMLAVSLTWPDKTATVAAPQTPAVATPLAAAGTPVDRLAVAPAPPEEPSAASALPTADWIPVLGRSAAGVPQFWKDDSQGHGIAKLSEIVQRHTQRVARTLPAVSTGDESAEPLNVQLISLSEPTADNVTDFVASDAIKSRHPDAFAVRIDGDSMSPEIRHGDIVICSPSCPAADGQCAVVQLVRQIGVTCKVFRRQDDLVHLVPINEQYPPQVFPASQVVWAVRVLARVTAKRLRPS